MTFSFPQVTKQLFCECFEASHKWESAMFYVFHSSQGSKEFIKLRLQDAWTCPGQLFTLSSQKEHFPSLISCTSWSSSQIISKAIKPRLSIFMASPTAIPGFLTGHASRAFGYCWGWASACRIWNESTAGRVFVEMLLAVPCPRKMVLMNVGNTGTSALTWWGCS